MNNLSKTTCTVGLEHGKFPCFTAREEGHVPFNKRRWEIEKSTASLKVVDCKDGGMDGDGWLEFNLSETTQAKENGPFQTRTISLYLHGDDRRKFIAMLQGAA